MEKHLNRFLKNRTQTLLFEEPEPNPNFQGKKEPEPALVLQRTRVQTRTQSFGFFPISIVQCDFKDIQPSFEYRPCAKIQDNVGSVKDLGV